MSGEKRRNIFLCIKESLNNIVKHANATVVTISFRLGPHLVIQIHDNGVGVNPEKIREFSSGMTNMRKRMENIDGHFGIRSNDGTTITLSVPLQ
jgi:signal transduction histidine kinase